jgi:hypothetical protein
MTSSQFREGRQSPAPSALVVSAPSRLSRSPASAPAAHGVTSRLAAAGTWGERGRAELVHRDADEESLTGSFRGQPGGFGETALAEGCRERLRSMAGQPGPSSWLDTSHAASRRASGGAARHARAYRSISVRRSSPTIPAESSMYPSAAVTRSTARRASGPALAASPASIMASMAAATAWAFWEYSRRPSPRRGRTTPTLSPPARSGRSEARRRSALAAASRRSRSTRAAAAR